MPVNSLALQHRQAAACSAWQQQTCSTGGAVPRSTGVPTGKCTSPCLKSPVTLGPCTKLYPSSPITCRVASTEVELAVEQQQKHGVVAAVESTSRPVVTIKLNYHAEYGEVVKLAGDSVHLGKWKDKDALQLHWTEGDVWVAHLALTPGTYECKFMLFDTVKGTVNQWEEGANRRITVPDNPGYIEAPCTWNAPVNIAVPTVDGMAQQMNSDWRAVVQAAAAATEAYNSAYANSTAPPWSAENSYEEQLGFPLGGSGAVLSNNPSDWLAEEDWEKIALASTGLADDMKHRLMAPDGLSQGRSVLDQLNAVFKPEGPGADDILPIPGYAEAQNDLQEMVEALHNQLEHIEQLSAKCVSLTEDNKTMKAELDQLKKGGPAAVPAAGTSSVSVPGPTLGQGSSELQLLKQKLDEAATVNQQLSAASRQQLAQLQQLAEQLPQNQADTRWIQDKLMSQQAETTSLQLQHQQLHDQIAGLQSALQAATSAADAAQAQRNELQSKYDKLSAEHNKLQQDYVQANATRAAEAYAAPVKNLLAVFKGAAESASAQLQVVAAQKEIAEMDAQKKVKALQQELSDLRKEMAAAKQASSKLLQQLQAEKRTAEMQSKEKIQLLEKQLATAQTDLEAARAEAAAAKRDAEEAHSQLKELLATKAALETQLQQQSADAVDLQQRMKQFGEHLASSDALLAQLQAEKAAAVQQLQQQSEVKTALEQQVRDLEQALEAARLLKEPDITLQQLEAEKKAMEWQLQQQIQFLQKQLSSYRAEASATQTSSQSEASSSTLAKLQADKAAADKQLQLLQQQLSVALEDAKKSKQELELLNQQMASKKTAAEQRLQHQVQVLERQLATAHMDLEAAKKVAASTLEQMQEEKLAMEQELEQTKSTSTASQQQQRVLELRTKELEQRLKELEHRLRNEERLQQQVQTMEKQLHASHDAQQRVKQLEQQLATAQTQLQDAKKDHHAAVAAATAAAASAKAASAATATSTQQAQQTAFRGQAEKQLQQQVQQLQRQLANAQADVRSAQRQVEAMRKEMQSMRNELQSSGRSEQSTRNDANIRSDTNSRNESQGATTNIMQTGSFAAAAALQRQVLILEEQIQKAEDNLKAARQESEEALKQLQELRADNATLKIQLEKQVDLTNKWQQQVISFGETLTAASSSLKKTRQVGQEATKNIVYPR